MVPFTELEHRGGFANLGGKKFVSSKFNMLVGGTFIQKEQ